MGTNAEMNSTYLKFYAGDLNVFTYKDVWQADALDQVLVLDANGDLLPDLFGEIADDPPRRVFWINKGDWSFQV